MSKQQVTVDMTPCVYYRRAQDAKPGDWMVLQNLVWNIHNITPLSTGLLSFEVHCYLPDRMRIQYIKYHTIDELVIVQTSLKIVGNVAE